MGDARDAFERADAARAARRDRDRRRRRDPERGFWRSIALVGSVGWPIVGLATLGAFGGHALDVRFGTGFRFALVLVTVGAALGSWAAWRAVKGSEP